MGEPLAALVGLGNPGPEYDDTRHNAGFWFVDRLAREAGAAWRHEAKLSASVCRVRVDGAELWLMKPSTFMNGSGTSVAALCRYYRLAPAQVLIAHDELDLAPGVARLKKGGGAGGHNGLTDIIARLGADFWRLRIGIGRPPPRRDLIPYVLGRPSREEALAIEAGLTRGLEVLPLIAQGDTQRAMNLLHTTGGETADGA